MEVKITNGSVVNRIWSDGNCELLAAFQYENDAILFAKALLASEEKAGIDTRSLAITCTYSGKMKIINRESALTEPKP